MKFNKMNILAMAAMLSLAVSSTACDDDDNVVYGEVSSRVTLKLAGYPTPAGGWSIPAWKDGDKAKMLVAAPGQSTPAYAEPILKGSASGDFLFKLTGYSNTENNLVAVYPHDANVTCADSQILYTVPTAQNGEPEAVLAAWTTAVPNSYEGVNLELKPIYTTLVVPIERGNYTITAIEVTANGGENIAGNVTIDPVSNTATASEATVKSTFAQGLDCTAGSKTAVVMLAPVNLSQGYTIKATMADGDSFSITDNTPVTLKAGDKVDAGALSNHQDTRIAFCGSDKVYIIKPFEVKNSYTDAVEWSFDAKSLSPVLGLATSRCTHLDDCKPVDQGKKLLLTSSYHWTALIDIATNYVLFHSNVTQNAHSAEMLPGNRIAVACSSGGDEIQLYDIDKPNKVIFSTPLISAHGVVWLESKQRLYAIGGQLMYVYKLVDWDTNSPKLEAEKVINTPRSGLHDLSLVDENTLCVSGSGSYLFNATTESFNELTQFTNASALKSVNYNPVTNEAWYTDATIPEGTQTWSTHTLHYSTNPMGTTDFMQVKCTDIDIYKVRVVSW